MRAGRGCGPEAEGRINTPLPPPSGFHMAPVILIFSTCFLFSGTGAPLTLLPHFSAALAFPPPHCAPHFFPIPLSNLSPPPLDFSPSFPPKSLPSPSFRGSPFPPAPVLLLLLALLHSPPLLSLPSLVLPLQLEYGSQKKCLVYQFTSVGSIPATETSRSKVACQAESPPMQS